MKKLLLTTSFLTLLSSVLLAGNDTVTEIDEICKSPAGCSIIMKTGECPDCVSKTTKIVIPIRRWYVKKDKIEVPESYYKYGYPTPPEINLLTSTFMR